MTCIQIENVQIIGATECVHETNMKFNECLTLRGDPATDWSPPKRPGCGSMSGRSARRTTNGTLPLQQSAGSRHRGRGTVGSNPASAATECDSVATPIDHTIYSQTSPAGSFPQNSRCPQTSRTRSRPRPKHQTSSTAIPCAHPIAPPPYTGRCPQI